MSPSSAPSLRERLNPLADPVVGLVAEPGLLPFPLGSGAMPIATAYLGDAGASIPAIRRYERWMRTSPEQIDGSGGGFDVELAKAVSVAEALERYCCAMHDPADLRWATATELGDDALDLDTLPRLSEAELSRPRLAVTPAAKDAPRHWVRGVRLSDGKPTWLPAMLAYLFFVPSDGENLANPITTGCAVHTDPVLALVKGLVEVIERDATAIAWHQQLPLPELELDTGDPELHRLMAAYDRNPHVDVRLFDATTDVGVPAVFAVRVDRRSTSLRHVAICAANLDPRLAAVNAVREVLSCHISFLHQVGDAPARAEDCYRTADGALFTAHASRAEAFDFLLNRTPPRRALSELPTPPANDSAESLRWLVDRLAAAGAEAYAVDLTTDEARAVGMTAVKAIVPGLQPMSFVRTAQFLGHPRLYAAPAAMGYPVRAEADLNPWPQPVA
ncbi:YcaO-like family protein [Amycolatopsis sp. GA6-003]|uniref:YcaO-like family protein n=1 Tax=Amycolatopsis sp. GA6-003 TaxID=2652444 RepID=UPI0039174166